MSNFEQLDFKGSGVNRSNKESGLNEYAASLFDPSLTWADLDWLKSVTTLPIVLKGILTGLWPYLILINIIFYKIQRRGLHQTFKNGWTFCWKMTGFGGQSVVEAMDFKVLSPCGI